MIFIIAKGIEKKQITIVPEHRWKGKKEENPK